MEEKREKIKVLHVCGKSLSLIGLLNGWKIGILTIPKRIIQFVCFFLLTLIPFLLFEYCYDLKFDLKRTCGALSIASMGVQSEINYFYMIIKDDTIRKSIDHLQSLVNQSNKIEPCLTLLNLMLVLLYCLINSFEFYLMVRMQKFN